MGKRWPRRSTALVKVTSVNQRPRQEQKHILHRDRYRLTQPQVTTATVHMQGSAHDERGTQEDKTCLKTAKELTRTRPGETLITESSEAD